MAEMAEIAEIAEIAEMAADKNLNYQKSQIELLHKRLLQKGSIICFSQSSASLSIWLVTT